MTLGLSQFHLESGWAVGEKSKEMNSDLFVPPHLLLGL